jgi:hypothetical protein
MRLQLEINGGSYMRNISVVFLVLLSLVAVSAYIMRIST